ncbi:MAG TPA: ABC transporter substrate-binding protein [Chloroflexota bacterium]|jgi:ABC-type nitrate/sulfonate/bicarbonate transport system substrate-binding protein
MPAFVAALCLALLVASGACAQGAVPAAPPPAAAPAGGAAAPVVSGGSVPDAPPAPPPPAHVVMAYVNALDNAPLFVGVDRGYWQEQGIDLETQPVQTSADAIAFLANGQLDAAMGSIAVPLYNAVQQGMDVRIIAPVAYARPIPVFVRKELVESGAVKTTADLRGRRVYTNAPGSGANYARIKWQENAGLRTEDVDVVNMSLQDTPLAMANGQIDAGTFSDPWATRIAREGYAIPLDPGPMSDRLSIVIMAGTRLRHDAVDVGRRYLLAYLKALRDVQTDEELKSDATVETFAHWTGNQPDVVRSLQFMPRFDPNLYIDVDNLLDQQRVHIASRATTYTEPLPADRLIDTSLADYALQQLGRQ